MKIAWRSALLLMALGVCAVAQAQTLNRGNGGEPDSLDPAFAGSLAEEAVLDDLMTGLTTRDAAGHPVPGAALRWETSPDGLTWTFHLRPERWSDGAPVTAGDFIFAWRRLLDPKTGARYAYNLWPLRNARAISAGRMPPTALGVSAPDPRTLTLTLEHPAPYLPELLAHPSALPVPQHLVEKQGALWTRPGLYAGNGPFILKEWIPGDHITLARNPRFYDAAAVTLAGVRYFPTADADAALRRFRAGELDLQTPAPLTQIGWLKANLPGALRVTPALAISYVAINLRDPPLQDARVRRALNLAYYREALVGKVLKLGERPAFGLVPPQIAGISGARMMDFHAWPFPARLAQAQRLMQQAGYGPFQRLRLTYETSAGADNRRLAALFQAMLKPIYVDLTISAVDPQIHLRNLRLRQFELASASWYADFDDASNFLDLLRSDAGNNYAGYRNPRFDAAMDTAMRQPDAAARARPGRGGRSGVGRRSLDSAALPVPDRSGVAAGERLDRQSRRQPSQPLPVSGSVTAAGLD